MENTLGRRISEYRRRQGLTQEEVAETLGISSQAVSKWENDVSCPDILLLPELARLLGVTVDALLSGEKATEVQLVPAEKRKSLEEMMLRLVVNSSGGDKVKINLPMAFITMALDAGAGIPMVSGSVDLKGIDLNKIVALAEKGLMGKLLQVETESGDTVDIFVE